MALKLRFFCSGGCDATRNRLSPLSEVLRDRFTRYYDLHNERLVAIADLDLTAWRSDMNQPA